MKTASQMKYAAECLILRDGDICKYSLVHDVEI